MKFRLVPNTLFRTLLLATFAFGDGAVFAQTGQQATPPAASGAVPTAAAGATQATTPAAAAAQELPDAPSAAAQVKPQAVPTGPTVVMDTTMGRMTCKLFDQQAPLATANFIALAEGTKDWDDPTTHKKMRHKRLYDGTLFHRVIPDFMIQGGDPTGTGMGDPGYYFSDEFSPDISFDIPGRLAMANSGPNTNGSQFFITTAPAEHLNGKHTIFGQCDPHSVLVAQAITAVERNQDDKPLTDVVLSKVTIIKEGQPMPPMPPAPPTSVAPANMAPAQAAH